jgi:hypothetical protein
VELFTIQCTTCRARLKVKDESAIGDILACPKCGSMVQVVPPVGWKRASASDVIPLAAVVPLAPQIQTPVAAKSKAAAAPPALPARAAPGASGQLSGIQARPAAQPARQVAAELAVVAPAQEIVATVNVTTGRSAVLRALGNTLSARIKHDGLLYGCGLGGVLVGACVYWLAFSATAPAVVAVIDETATVAAEPTESTPAAPPANVGLVGAVEATATNTTPLPTEEHAVSQKSDESAAEEESTVATVIVAPSAEVEKTTGELPADDAKPHRSGPAIKLDPLPSPAPTRDATSADNKPSTAADDLAAVDENPEHAAATAVGPAVNHDPADAPATHTLSRTEIEERLSQELPTVRFAKVPLAQFVEFIADFSALPITIDDEGLKSVGKTRQTRISVNLTHITANEALRSAIAPLGLTCAVREGKVVVTIAKPRPADSK